jgi:probable HAF family extracellular repeat protein
VAWDGNLNLIDLQTQIPADSGWQLWDATGVNSAGQIVGFGSYNGAERAFLLTPDASAITAPEPASVVFLGLPWLLFRRNRKTEKGETEKGGDRKRWRPKKVTSTFSAMSIACSAFYQKNG